MGQPHGPPGQKRVEHAGEGLHRRRDGNFIITAAKMTGHGPRIIQAHLRRVGRRHHHRLHPLGSQGIDGNAQHQG